MATPFEQAFAPYMNPQGSSNVLSQILGVSSANTPAPQMPDISPQSIALPEAPQVRAPRERASLLDIIGGIADTVATVGGSAPLYQPTLDARADRERQAQLQGLQQRQIEQGIQANDYELSTLGRSDIGQALAGLTQSENPSADWPILAQQLGIPPDKAAAIGAQIDRNPAIVGQLAVAFGYKPQSQGSQPKELQIYELLQQRDPAAAEQYLGNLVQGDTITPYQMAQLGLSQQARDLDERRFNESVRQFETRQGAGASNLTPRQGAGASNLTPKQRGEINEKLEKLPTIQSQLARVRTLAEEIGEGGQDIFARGPAGGFIPGRVAGGSADQFDKAVAALTSSIRSLTRTPGEGSMSDFESRLAIAQLPSRADSDAGRAEAIANLDRLIRDIDSGYKRLLTPAAPARPPTGGNRNVRGGRPDPAIEAELRRRGLLR